MSAKLPLKHHILFTSALVGTALMGYGRRVYAACANTGGTTYLCSGANGALSITANEANVSTAAGFGVNAAGANGLSITGQGALSFTDHNQSTILANSVSRSGLYLRGTGNDGGTAGSITVVTDAGGQITGTKYGIFAKMTAGSGMITITANGNASGTNGSSAGIQASDLTGTGINITTGASSTISGRSGIRTAESGTGATNITVNGTLNTFGSGSAGNGIYATNGLTSTDLNITTAAGSTINANGYGIDAYSRGTGAMTIKAYGAVTGTHYGGITAYNRYGTSLLIKTGTNQISGYYFGISATDLGSGPLTINTSGDVVATASSLGVGIGLTSATDISVTTAAGHNITGNIGIAATGTGVLDFTIDGTVTGTTGNAMNIVNGNGTNMTITSNAGSNISGGLEGIYAYNHGTGVTSITVNGDVTGNNGSALDILNGNGGHHGTDMIITTGAAGHVIGSMDGITAHNYGSGYLSIMANGVVTGTTAYGIDATNSSFGTDLNITTGAGSIVNGGYSGITAMNHGTNLVIATGAGGAVNGNNFGIQAFGYGSGMTSITIGGDVTGNSRASIAVKSQGSGPTTITTNSGTTVSGYNQGIYSYNYGTGATSITVNGNVSASGTNSVGLSAENINGTNLTVMTGAGSHISGIRYGIYSTNYGTGSSLITVNGNVSSLGPVGYGVIANNSGTDLTVTTGTNSQIISTKQGIRAINNGTGALSVTVNGTVTSTSNRGVRAINHGTTLSLATGVGSQVTGVMAGLYGWNIGTGALTITNAGSVTGVIGLVARSGAGGGTITNAATGVITGTGGTAISLVGLLGATSLVIDGGRIIGNVVDTAPGNGFSSVNVAHDFTSEGNFTVSNFGVASGAAFTLGSGKNVNSANAVTASGTLIAAAADNSSITGSLNVLSGGALDAAGNFNISGALNNRGAVTVETGKVLTVGTMSAAASVGTLSFGVASASDHGELVVAGGAANLTNQTIAVTVTNGQALRGGDRILVIDGTGAIVGGPGATPVTVVDNSAFYSFRLVDGTGAGVPGGDNSQAYLEVSLATPQSLSDNTNNQQAATALQSLTGTTDPQLSQIEENLNNAPTPQAINDILSSVGPTVDMSAPIAAANVSGNTFDLETVRLAVLRDNDGATGMSAGDDAGVHALWDDGLGMWGEGFGQHARQDARQGVAGFNANTFGGAVGIDTRNLSDKAIVGVGFSYGRTTASSRNVNYTRTNTDSYQLSLYGDYDLDANTFLDGLFGYSWNDVETARHNVGGIAGLNANGNYHANQFSGQAALGRHYYTQVAQTVLTPSLLLDGIHYDPQSYTETGAGGANLHVDGKALDLVQIGAGLKAGWELKDPQAGTLRPELGVSYRYAVVNDRLQDNVNFTGGGAAFQAQGPTPARSSLDLTASLALKTKANWTVSAAYDLELKQDYVANTGMIRAAYRFK